MITEERDNNSGSGTDDDDDQDDNLNDSGILDPDSPLPAWLSRSNMAGTVLELSSRLWFLQELGLEPASVDAYVLTLQKQGYGEVMQLLEASVRAGSVRTEQQLQRMDVPVRAVDIFVNAV